MADLWLDGGERGLDWPAIDPAPLTMAPTPVVVSRVTTWSDGTVHVERPGEATMVVAPLTQTWGGRA